VFPLGAQALHILPCVVAQVASAADRLWVGGQFRLVRTSSKVWLGGVCGVISWLLLRRKARPSNATRRAALSTEGGFVTGAGHPSVVRARSFRRRRGGRTAGPGYRW